MFVVADGREAKKVVLGLAKEGKDKSKMAEAEYSLRMASFLQQGLL